MTGTIGLALKRSLAALPWLPPRLASTSATAAPHVDQADVAAALAAAGAWFFAVDAEHRIRDVFPLDAAIKAALIGQDIRSFIDPLDPLDEHPRMVRAFRDRAPFRDCLMAADFGRGRRLLRVSGEPIYRPTGEFAGYRGLAVDGNAGAARPDANVALLAPDLRSALTNTLGVIVGFAQFLKQDLPADGAQAAYAARVLVAAEAARNIVAASHGAAPSRPQPDIQPSVPHTRPAGAPAGGRILLVHECPEIGDLLSIAFERAGFECAVCRDGTEAVEILDEEPGLWDVLVTTAAGSEPGGVALIRLGRALRPQLLCVVCDAPAAAALAQAEADLCWPTPADAPGLARVVRAHLAHLAG